MVIQRWQTVWLLMAAILAAVFCFVPMASIADDMSPESATFLRPADIPVLFVVDGVVALLLFIAIFLYKNTARQRTVTLVSMLLIVVVMVTEVCYLLSWGAGRHQGRVARKHFPASRGFGFGGTGLSWHPS